jgi:hypothetical protein
VSPWVTVFVAVQVAPGVWLIRGEVNCAALEIMVPGVITAELGAGTEDDGNKEPMIDDVPGSAVVNVASGSVEDESVAKICVAPLVAMFSRARTTELVPC